MWCHARSSKIPGGANQLAKFIVDRATEIAIQDLAVAGCAYQAALAPGLGPRLQLD